MPDTICHSDRGAEYSSSACVQACQRLGLRRSMSRTGSCLDNAVAESWFASLKVELVHRQHYRTRAEAPVSTSRGEVHPSMPTPRTPWTPRWWRCSSPCPLKWLASRA
jgi:transposase InsO family protein